MIVSTLSVFLSGSKRTRLLRQGIAGQTVEIVAVSWMANPCGRSSRSIRLRMPPAFGVGDGGGAWLVAGPTRADGKSTRLNSSHDQISYAVFCLKKKKKKIHRIKVLTGSKLIKSKQ